MHLMNAAAWFAREKTARHAGWMVLWTGLLAVSAIALTAFAGPVLAQGTEDSSPVHEEVLRDIETLNKMFEKNSRRPRKTPYRRDPPVKHR